MRDGLSYGLRIWNGRGSLQTQCTGSSYRKFLFFVFLFHDDLHPVPTFDGLYLEWYPVWSDEASNSQQLLGPTSHTGLWDIPRSRGTLRPDCHILAYQSTEVKRAEYMDSVSIPTSASLQCGPPSARDVAHPLIVPYRMKCNETGFKIMTSLVLKNTKNIAG